jgi:pectinesterase
MATKSLIPRLALAVFAALAAGAGEAAATPAELIVAADGSGKYRTVQEAVAAVPDSSPDRTVIRIKPGRYQGPILVPKAKAKVTFRGDDPERTILTYGLNIYESEEARPGDKAPAPLPRSYRGTGVVVLGDDFHAERVTFQNTSGDHGQALALRIDGDRAVLTDCRVLGWQDTLRVNNGRQYFSGCYVEGRVDFIYGSGTTVFDRCEIHSKNGGYVTAASTPENQPFGFVFRHCRLTGDPTSWSNPWPAPDAPGAKAPRAHLGRPWRPHASVAFLYCEMGDHVHPEGWDNWRNAENEKTARYAEYKNTGPGANRARRVKWAKELTDEEAAKFTAENVLHGADSWNPAPEVRIVLVGDSTVTEDAGWGGAFAGQLAGRAECINLARGGRSSGSFVAEGRWRKCLELKPDYVLIQFGHNDQPGHGPDRETDPKTSYRKNMERYVKEARAAGIRPVLVTPLTRREFGPNGKIRSSLAPYADVVKEIAAEMDVPLVNLHAKSIELCEALGPEGCKVIAPRTKEDRPDGTHLNRAGAERVAPLVADELRRAVPKLAKYIGPAMPDHEK